MKNIAYILVVVVLVLFIGSQVRADSKASQEYQVKAAFLYNFIKFVDWPKEEKADVNEPITIGIIGSEDFIKAFEPIKGKKIKDRSISIKYFAGYEELKRSNADDRQWDKKMEALKVCHVLMFCSCDSFPIQNSNQIIKALEGSPILTVGETEYFLESGGAINFLVEDKKVHFEINYVAAKRGKLKISSQLLRLANRLIEKDVAEEAKD